MNYYNLPKAYRRRVENNVRDLFGVREHRLVIDKIIEREGNISKLLVFPNTREDAPFWIAVYKAESHEDLPPLPNEVLNPNMEE